MSREATLAVAREVIAELVAAVDRHGAQPLADLTAGQRGRAKDRDH